MKNFLVCLVISFISFSCSSDSTSDLLQPDNATAVASMDSSVLPHNLSNPFDQTGIEFYDKLHLYTVQHGYASSANQVVQQMLFISKRLQEKSSTSKSTITLTSQRVEAILNNPQQQLEELILTSSLATEVKLSLLGFVSDLVLVQQEDYDQVYDFIVSYETAVLDATDLDIDTKDTVLKVASITRYSMFEEARRRDRDWETSVTNKLSQSTSERIPITLVTLCVLFETFY